MGWRDAALSKLGYSPGRVGYRAYANALMADQGTKWGYVAFFTKYQLRHFAYAVDEKLVMNYANDNWGPDNIHRVFAHESCHIFGASDEYGSCVCGEIGGELNGPNKNCVNCQTTQVPCLMNANTLQFCKWTKNKSVGMPPSSRLPRRRLLQRANRQRSGRGAGDFEKKGVDRELGLAAY